jgi:hypothetical protein
LLLPEGPQRVLRFKRQPAFHCPLPTLLLSASPASHSRVAASATASPTFSSGKLCVGYRGVCTSLRTEKRDRCRRSDDVWSTTTYTQFATWAAVTNRYRSLRYGCLKWVRRPFKALATGSERQNAV